MEMETRRREIARRKRRRQRQLKRRLAGSAAVIAVGLAAFVCWWGSHGGSEGAQLGIEDVKGSESLGAGIGDAAGSGSQEDMDRGRLETDLVSVVELPGSYDLREHKSVIVAPDQGTFATCWAFASLKAVETSVPESLLDVSEGVEAISMPRLSADHMSLKNSFGLGLDDGGNYAISSAYLLAWQGPVSDVGDPYGDGKTVEDAEPLYHVQEMQILKDGDFEAIKRGVFETGGVQSSLYVPEEGRAMQNRFYNEETNAYYYHGTEKPNHEVLIIGWDDAYPKEAFVQEPEHDGAFLCMNTWGEGFGSAGFFYISYEDSRIGEDCVVYTGIEPVENYDRIFQTDLCGWTGQIGYGGSKAWFANVYEADAELELAAAGFYATKPDTEYRVYVAEAGEAEPAVGRLGDRRLVAEGRLERAGYYTIPFETPALMSAGARFCVMVEMDSPGAVEPVAIEYRSGERTAKVDIGDGEGYISFDGAEWERTETEHQCNVCLKVYANVR